jgi:CheY-like chemotaxis protein
VDDEKIVRELAKEMLESCGYRTLEQLTVKKA